MEEWHSSACILCENNCGIKVQLGGEGERHIVRIRGDEDHPASAGYLCQKASGLDYYQNGKDRLTSPLRRTAAGDFEEVSWETAIREVAAALKQVQDTHGGDKIFYYGGGGQGNHLPGAYSTATRKVLGSIYRSNALAQEKTGEFWVNGAMFGKHVRGDFERCDVAVFLGKNPWHSHGIPRARAWIREFIKRPDNTLIVIDPVVSETAKFADIHLRVKPGSDAWLLAAMLGILVQQQLYKPDWVAEHTEGVEEVIAACTEINVDAYCERAGIDPALAQQAVAAIAEASGAAVFEDLGVQMNRHSTLVSYLEKLLWVLCGHFGNSGGQNIPVSIQNIAGSGRSSRHSPVANAPIISGLVPCNVIAEEILSDHPDRYRAMIIETANPVHSLAQSEQMSEALRSMDFVVAIDIAMTETTRQADYILPASTQYEKWEATFFNFETPENYFHLRKPLFPALENTLSEAEIHARLVEELGALPMELCGELRDVLNEQGRDAYRDRFLAALSENPLLSAVAPILLYRTLGPSLPHGAREAAVLWPLCLSAAMNESEALSRAGFAGDAFSQADQLFDTILSSHSGTIFAVDAPGASWSRLGEGVRIKLHIPELMAELRELQTAPTTFTSTEFPFILSAGERRDYTANSIFRDADWRRKDRDGALRLSPEDASRLEISDGEQVRLITAAGSVVAAVDITDRMQVGHLSLPNGFGVENRDGERLGVAPNELTNTRDRDKFAGTPWHKSVPARVERMSNSAA